MKTFNVCLTSSFNSISTKTIKSPSLWLLILDLVSLYPNNLDIAIFDKDQSRFVAHKPSNDGWQILATSSLKASLK